MMMLLKPFFLILSLFWSVQTAYSATIHVQVQQNLQEVINQAKAGDVLRLASGVYRGKIIINKPLTIEGPKDHSAKIEGDRTGRTIAVHAPDVVLRQLTVTRSGLSLPAMDAGIYLEETASRALVEHNRILENSVGVFLHGAADAMVRHNVIEGDKQLRRNERGNGVSVWNAPRSQVIDNDISYGRDGIFSNTSSHNIYKNNRFSHLRYAVHYMYTNDSEVSGNISIGNDIGYAMMFSERLIVKNNIAVKSNNQGIMLNYINHSDVDGNVVDGADKCVFLYNANHNRLINNHFEACNIGIHFTAAIEGTTVSNNAFINNQNQIKYVSTRYVDWAESGQGNYWSDNSTFDLDGDGVGDQAYRPNGIIDQIVWRAPVARLLMNSPAIHIVKWAQSQFPAILPGGVVDSKPLMTPPKNATFQRYKDLS